MKKLLRASVLIPTIVLLALIVPSLAYAKGTTAVEQTILSTKIVPEAEVTRISNDISLCSTDGSEVSAATNLSCQETYPLGTRVNITGSEGKRVITIRDSKNNLLTAETGLGATSIIRDAEETKVAERPNPNGSDLCSMLNIGQCFLNLPAMLVSGIAFLLLTLSSLLLGIAGVVFNWVVIRTVFQFALYFGTSPGMLVAWGVIRDIANIALLFGFIFMGIATILNTQGMEGYTAKKALPRLIIFAVLLNFSLFATQAVIDVSNGFSSVFASYAGEQCETTTSSVGVDGQSNERCSNVGISGKIIQAAGISTVFPSGFTPVFEKPYTYSVMLIILALLVTVAAMVLFAAAIMLVIRVVVLSLLMVTSPIGFAGMAIPALQPIAKDWWHKLINQSFFAPIYLLMIFISLKLVDGLQEGNTSIADALLGNTASASASVATATTTAGNMQVIVVFIIVIGFMVAALMIAQKMGAYGASFATKSAAAVTFGAHGFVARRTVGRASAAIAHNIRNSDFGETSLGKTFAGVADYGGKASFSTRNLVGAGLKVVSGPDIGKANKNAGHGYHGIEEKAVKERVEYAKSLSGRAETDQEFAVRKAKDMPLAKAAKVTAETAKAEASRKKQAAESAVSVQTAALDKVRSEIGLITYQGGQVPPELEQKLAATEAALAEEQKSAQQAIQAIEKSDKEIVSAEELIKKAEKRGEITKKQQQAMFAKNIEHAGLGWPTVDSHANHVAAAKIVSETKKSDVLKAIESAAKEEAERASKSDGDHGGGDHGGGGAHAPKAKASGGAHDDHAHG